METLIQTTQGPMRASQLLRREDSFNEDIGSLTAVEYCVLDCPGQAHQTGQRDAPEHFCNLHVHRSVNLTVKEGLDISGVLNTLLGA